MRNVLLLTLSFLLVYSVSFAQCVNNPSIQQGNLNPAPLPPQAGGIAQFSYFENLLDYTDEENDPITVTLCLLNITPVSGSASVAGNFAPVFNWLYDPGSNCLQGTQNQDIFGGTGGLISVVFNQSSPIDCPNNQMGYNANLQPAACMNGINETVDDTESVYTCYDSTLPPVPPMPIELSSFEGDVDECKGIISWTTQSEVNFSHFELEKSVNGVSFFTLDAIPGKGGTSSTSYSYIDTELRALNYYRLKAIDLDGTVNYSKIIALDKDGCFESDVEFDIYPNPVIDTDLTISIDSKHRNANVTLVVTDVLGRVLVELPTKLMRGANLIELPVKKLADATYFVGVRGADIDNDTKKFVKISN